MPALFITGATGFIGSRLLQNLPYEQYDAIYCLSRTQIQYPTTFSPASNITFLRGGLYDSEVYQSYLSSVETVIHLAAITGKATRKQFFSVNSQGTQFLLEQCRQADVKNFLYISTIATKYPDISNYYYAQSKEQGETAVRNSGLNYAIVRPTIVLGKQAAIWRSLSGLARLPIIPVFGDGQAVIQPIYIDDLIDCLISILNNSLFLNQTFELGGREKITFEQFLMKIHFKYSGKHPVATVHLPLKPLQSVLTLLEKPFFSMLPITAGQLSAFGNNGTVQENELFLEHVSRMKTVDEMLEAIISMS